MKVIPGNAQCALRLISTFLLKKMSNYFALRGDENFGDITGGDRPREHCIVSDR